MSMRAISRVSDVSNTVKKLLEETGAVCAEFQDKSIRGLTIERVQCQEIWVFCYVKEKNVAREHKGVRISLKGELGYGDAYTWTAIDADAKLMVSYMLGERDAGYANLFMQDLAERITNRVQLTTDGHKPYLQAVEGAFGGAELTMPYL
jgi:hypothetical protein